VSNGLRVAVVVQRFGVGAIGGAEWHAAQLVECLREHHEVTVLTSCARDAMTWAMEIDPGITVEQGVRVHRFAHPPRNAGHRARVPLRHKLRRAFRGVCDALGANRVSAPTGDDRDDGHDFLRQQGPACAGLLDALMQGHGRHDVTVFFTALYHPTAEGLPLWGPRSVLVPTLHDEKPMYLPWFHRVFGAAGVTLFNTRAEAELARRLYGDSIGPSQIVGAPVAVSEPEPAAILAARARYALPERYLVYVGRIEKGKGCEELLQAWERVASAVPGTALVFIGRGSVRIAESAHTRCTGFVSDAERDALVAGAAALVMPARLESLSLVLLEAMALGVPVLANGRSEVLAAHVEDSQGGRIYRGAAELRAELLRMLRIDESERRGAGDSGRRYVAERYRREVVHRAWLDAVEAVAGPPSLPPGR
jgi:glycosyltransferase involved in cell wall biosynthesis